MRPKHLSSVLDGVSLNQVPTLLPQARRTKSASALSRNFQLDELTKFWSRDNIPFIFDFKEKIQNDKIKVKGAYTYSYFYNDSMILQCKDVVKNDPLLEEDTFIYVMNYGKYLNELNRDGLTLPGEKSRQ